MTPMSPFVEFVIYFTIYAFFGWLWELVYCGITLRRWHWRGFLATPILPIYGFSVLAVVLFVEPYIHNPFLVFLSSAAVVTLIELVTGWCMRHVFHIRLWDYSDMPFDLKGYISLYTSLGFGVLGLFVVYVLQPLVTAWVMSFDVSVARVVASIVTIVIAIDFTNSVSSLLQARGYLRPVGVTLDDVQHRVELRIRALQRQGRSVTLFVQRLLGWNLERLRKAFPGAVVVPWRSRSGKNNKTKSTSA